MGERGISDVLNFSQVVLSLILPIVSAPLIYFTANRKIMTVIDEHGEGENEDENTPLTMPGAKAVDYTNSRWLTISAFIVWAIIGALNCYLVFSFLLGADVHF